MCPTDVYRNMVTTFLLTISQNRTVTQTQWTHLNVKHNRNKFDG